MSSIDEFYIDNEYDNLSIGMNDLEGIPYGSQTQPDIKSGDDRFKIRDLIKQTQNERKGA